MWCSRPCATFSERSGPGPSPVLALLENGAPPGCRDLLSHTLGVTVCPGPTANAGAGAIRVEVFRTAGG